VNKMNQKEKK